MAGSRNTTARLNATRLQNLIFSKCVNDQKEGKREIDSVGTLTLPLDHSYKPTIEYIKMGSHFIFQVSKDAASKENIRYLPYIGDVIATALQQIPENSYTLLLPTHQCRGYCKLSTLFFQREHIVLAELSVNKAAQQPYTLNIHDSQSGYKIKIYPDKFKEISAQLNLAYNFYTDYHTYGQQPDYDSCGYFVFAYIWQRLAGEGCDKITASLPNPFLDFPLLKVNAENIEEVIPFVVGCYMKEDLSSAQALDWPVEFAILSKQPSAAPPLVIY